MGIVQGLTEFLPVSSSGHLVLLQKIFGIQEGTMFFDTMLHVGTLFAITIVFWKDIVNMLRRPFSKLPMYIVAATIPTIIIALVLKKPIEKSFATASTLGVHFLITGVVLLFVESRPSGHKTLKDMELKDALLIGTAQGIAIFPAISRSGMTIAGALFQKLDRKFAARFSFLMSIPAILGSVVLQAKDITQLGTAADVAPIVFGTLAAAISGFFAIKIMLQIITNKSLKGFAYYVISLGSLVVLDQLLFHIFF